jgi:Family of unknown function (DUF5681)
VLTPKRTPNPRSLKNLKPAWQPGESGNPCGRPKRALTEAYQAQLGRIKKGDAQKRTYAELVAEAQIKKALRGNTMAAKEIADRSEGRARQAVEVAIETIPNINLRVVFVDSDGKGHPEPIDVCPTAK